jgi:hypothetical protein
MPAKYLKTLRYWFDVEALMYPDIPKPGKRRSYSLRYSDKFPWPTTPQKDVTEDHKFFVYFGQVEKKVLEQELFELFTPKGKEEESFGGNHKRKTEGRTFLCAIEISAAGMPIVSSLQLAAYSVAFASRKNGKRLTYSAVLDSLKDKVKNLLSDSATGIATGEWFQQVTDFLVEELSWHPQELLAREHLCAHRVPLVNTEGKPFRKVPEMDPINSFFLDDLERLLLEAEQGSGSKQVERYLGLKVDEKKRTDVTSLHVAIEQLEAKKFPVARWPSKFPLFLMQQVAVNTGLKELTNGGIFSINGPPGTGKTTLLMDVIAARTVDRAILLAKYSNPQTAFTQSPETVSYPPNASGKSINGACFHLDDELLDCGIVVASANNNAVENITLDLPSMDKVFPQPLMFNKEPFDYFSASAESILNFDEKKKGKAGATSSESEEVLSGVPDETEAEEDEHDYLKCWGLVSVALGSKKNRNRVATCLGKFGEFGFANEITGLDSIAYDWDDAKAKFKAAVEAVKEIQEAISRYDKAIPALNAANQKLVDARAKELMLSELYRSAQRILKSLGANILETDAQLTSNLDERKLLVSEWPWWRQLLARIFKPSRYREFQAQGHELSAEYDQLRATRASLKLEYAQTKSDELKTAAELVAAQAAVAALEKDVAQLTSAIAKLKIALGTAAFDPAEFAALSMDDQQKSLPRNNAKYHAARAEVFLAAMHLHKSFMKNAGKPFETNFRLALSMLGQDAYMQRNLPAMAPHLWATFFLAVPVVSSTFASISRCFHDLSEGQIGLLLVDEAGQAVPSNALGAIWRSKRALIVGDPLQVEPVITMDKRLDYAILKYHEAPEEHLLTVKSAQHLADHGNRYGSVVVQYDGSDLWIGSPLQVHRRCVDPMFSLSNEIAYNNKMVFGPDPNEEIVATQRRPLLGPSKWFNIDAHDFDEHFSPSEGNAAVDIVVNYRKNDWVGKKDGLPELFVISPFKSVATGMGGALRERLKEWAGNVDDEAVTKWLEGHVGTVHTFQGKECESVVFVLGGKTGGARNWAAGRPNFINVAATRAKRRFFVIGNQTEWAKTTFGAKMLKAMTR